MWKGLTTLQPVYNDRDIARVRKLYDEVEFHHRVLQALGKIKNSTRMYLPQ